MRRLCSERMRSCSSLWRTVPDSNRWPSGVEPRRSLDHELPVHASARVGGMRILGDGPRRRAGASGVWVVKDGARGWTAPDTKKPRLVGRGWVRDALDGVLASSATPPGEGVELELLPVSAVAQPLRLRAHGCPVGVLRHLADPDVSGMAHGMRCVVPGVGEDMGASIAIPIATDRSMSTTRPMRSAPAAPRPRVSRASPAHHPRINRARGAGAQRVTQGGAVRTRREAAPSARLARARAGRISWPCIRPRSPTIS